MCALVDKLHMLGYGHTLELELRCEPATSGSNLDYSGFLPKFRERGRVRILDTSSGETLEVTVRSFRLVSSHYL